MPKLRSFLRGARSAILIIATILGMDALLTGLVLPDNLFGLVDTERLARIYSPLYHHDLAPNRKIKNARWGDLRYEFSTNSLGFKDRAVRKVQMTAAGKRVLLMGDSFTEGNGFTFDDTFAGLLDHKLNEGEAQPSVEVLNAAVSSYSPAMYFRKVQYLLEERGLSVDAVAVFIDISDIDDEASGVRLNDVGNVVPRSVSAGDEVFQQAVLRLRSLLKKYSSLYRLISALNRQRKATRANANTCQDALLARGKDKDNLNADFFRDQLANPRSQWTWNSSLMTAWGEKGLDQASVNMTRLQEFLKARDIPLLIAVYPWPEQIFRHDLKGPQVEYWRRWAINHNVEFLNLFPAFINSLAPISVYRRYFVPCDVHWNRDGHELIADRLFKYIRSLDLGAFPAEGLGDHNS